MDNLCKVINRLDRKITVKVDNLIAMIEFDKIQSKYCTAKDEEGTCYSYEAIISSYFITLLNHFKSCNDNNLENDKLAQYAVLWLCHKLNKNSQNGVSNLKDIYDVYIKDNKKDIEKMSGEAYNSCKDIINKKIYSMPIDIKEMSRLYEALKALCKLYTECDEKKEKYTSCSRDAQDFANEFNKLNDDNRITENNLYSQILYALFNDYNSFKNGCAKNCSSCNDVPTLSEIKAPPSSSIPRKLIPVLLTFSIPFFLGIAYKNSLFGFHKRVQRKHLRERLKK
ncbi:CIR protein [Plasmodium chabaudi chabaudi]|uniref:CIR protein n=1 Tax=Plasmodium chabaudi chabaudi TaxID=31271 RepID=A0A4V0K262_PLACU|nr:CIR protein [Plasmodium chabaudi chabaudi]VTZ66923.1 CIR protein [Plasmodium chabaudi chabaudi]|eukprot:XP_016653129.1 CIR protein [Plasmodium chabaudi chabaudi]